MRTLQESDVQTILTNLDQDDLRKKSIKRLIKMLIGIADVRDWGQDPICVRIIVPTKDSELILEYTSSHRAQTVAFGTSSTNHILYFDDDVHPAQYNDPPSAFLGSIWAALPFFISVMATRFPRIEDRISALLTSD